MPLVTQAENLSKYDRLGIIGRVGSQPVKKLRLLQALITIHEEELMADWALAVKGEPIFKIEPLH